MIDHTEGLFLRLGEIQGHLKHLITESRETRDLVKQVEERQEKKHTETATKLSEMSERVSSLERTRVKGRVYVGMFTVGVPAVLSLLATLGVF